MLPLFFLFAGVLGLVLVICMWLMADAGILVKSTLTLLFFVSCALVLINPGIGLAALAILAIVMGGMTFGLEWLT